MLLTITYEPSQFAPVAAGTDPFPERLLLEVEYLQDVRTPEEVDAKIVLDTIARSQRAEVLKDGKAEVTIGTPFGDTIRLSLLKGDGTAAFSRNVTVLGGALSYAINAEDVKQFQTASHMKPGTLVKRTMRKAQLVPIGGAKPDFQNSLFSVKLISATDVALFGDTGALSGMGFDTKRTSAVEIDAQMAAPLQTLNWSAAQIGVDGRFELVFEQPVVKTDDETPQPPKNVGWVWWLSGDDSAIGFVHDDLSVPVVRNLVISLPALSHKPGTVHPADKDCDCEKPNASFNFTEAELVNNAGFYNEDPGSFCKPFSNPERIVSEKSFSVISRVQTPDISPLPSARLKSQQLLDLDPEPDAGPDPRPTGGAPRPERPDGLMVSAAAAPGGIRVVNYDREVLLRSLGRASKPTVHTEPAAVMQQAQAMPSGRTTMDAEHPVQWEDNIAQYQACSVALGHILEFRVRTRSNGYSLGTVASTLTLAPRQTKRIQKVEFERVERARREERQQQADSVNDEVGRERDYNDTVAANLSEWAAGSSESGSAAAAGGFGFVGPGFIGGVGGGTSSAWSSSEQSGERNTSASEQQRLRDSIRRHGDSLRRYQSTVVSEVTQQETVTGTTEVLRNPNYGHSLTVIYYQILRHLAVATEFAGVRECLYVPFAIKPFTLQRAYRWREALGRYLRNPRLARHMKYLRDVITNFETSTVKPGSRASQPLTYVRGSIYINMAIERPVDAEEGKFDVAQWRPYSSFFGVPAYGIWAKLAAQAVAARDAFFQREHAPTIAAKWLNKLQVTMGGSLVKADFTMATRYVFNQTVRVDFSVPVSDVLRLTRNSLVTVTIKADVPLPPGSVANVNRMDIRYGTADFERTIRSEAGLEDLVEPETGVTSTESAIMQFPTDSWDAVNEQELMRQGVAELIEHFNEHVEFYHKAVWWSMDRDRLMMMLDGFYVPNTNTGLDNKISIASVVDREPIAIIGNALVYRVGAGAFLGIDNILEPKQLYARYADREPAQDPLYISLPTDGLYAQTIMDECLALEEHQGSVDWVLNDPDPELGTIDPSLMMSRRADVSSTLTPTQMPSTIINLQNAPDAPAPTGLGAALSAVGNAGAFRDMAGLAGTQANAAAALQTAASLATNFGNQAAALKMADMASNAQATQNANQQLAAVQSAVNKGLISPEEGKQHANGILGQMHAATPQAPPHADPNLRALASQPGASVRAANASGSFEMTTPEDKKAEGGSETENNAEPEDGDTGPLITDFGLGAGHEGHVARSTYFDTTGFSNPTVAFAGEEHFDLGERGIQDIVDKWARAGLIGGGAFVMDSESNGLPLWLNDWVIVTPSTSNATKPYGDLPVGFRGHWQYIAPNPYTDGDGAPWTSATLKDALKTGKAVTLSMGDLVLLSGDLIERFTELSQAAGSSWRAGPVNIMKGYANGEAFALTGFRLMQFPTVGVLGKLADLKILERNTTDYVGLKSETATADPYWTRTKAVVEFLKKVKGPTGCSELLVLSRVLRKENSTLELLQRITPWVTDADTKAFANVLNQPIPSRNIDDLGLSFNALSRKGRFNLDLLQMVVSNGHYAQLALKNDPHFSPANWSRFQDEQDEALKIIDNALTTQVTAYQGPIPAEAIARSACGMHFLTDAFSTGHMRTPRAVLGQQQGLLGKVMHDLDNKIGLNVANGFGESWRAFGDGYLSDRSSFQKDLLKRMSTSGVDTAVDANERRIIAAMSSAIKHLHYQAQSHLAVLQNDSNRARETEILESCLGTQRQLKYDEYAPFGLPGDESLSKDEWIAMNAFHKSLHMLKHKPQPVPSASDWLTNSAANHPELLLDDGSVNIYADYSWEQHLTKAFKDYVLGDRVLEELLDITEMVLLAKNMPTQAATWYGPPEVGVQSLLTTLPENTIGPDASGR